MSQIVSDTDINADVYSFKLDGFKGPDLHAEYKIRFAPLQVKPDSRKVIEPMFYLVRHVKSPTDVSTYIYQNRGKFTRIEYTMQANLDNGKDLRDTAVVNPQIYQKELNLAIPFFNNQLRNYLKTNGRLK